MVHRFGEATEPALREQVAKALVYKGFRQGLLNQTEAKTSSFDEVVYRFGKATDPALREKVATALNGRGFSQLLQAKALGLQNPLATEHLRAALIDFNQAVSTSNQPSGMVRCV